MNRPGAPGLADFARPGRATSKVDLVTDRPFLFFLLSILTQGLHRLCGGNDLHVLTFSGCRRRPLFRNEADCDLFLKILEPVRRRCRLVVWGEVAMPEHVHRLASEPQREILSTAIQALKPGSVRSLEGGGVGSGPAFSQKKREVGERIFSQNITLHIALR